MANCPECHKSFGSIKAKEQHVNDKIHVKTKSCGGCKRMFGTDEAQQEHEDSGYHERLREKKTRQAKGEKKTKQATGEKKKTRRGNRKNKNTAGCSSSRSGYRLPTPGVSDLPTYTAESPSFLCYNRVSTPAMSALQISQGRCFDVPLTNGQLNEFIDNNLQPNEAFNKECNEDMDLLAKYLKDQSGLDVAEILKGGSLSKGTAIKGKADLDVVVYLNEFRNLDGFLKNVRGMVTTLESKIEQWASRNSPGWKKVEPEGTTPHAMQFRIRKNRGNEFVNVDLLPSIKFNILDKEIRESVYNDMDKMATNTERENLSGALTLLQRNFVKKQNANVKNMIRLVKHWKKTELEGHTIGCLPPSYMLELVTIDAWEKAGKPDSFDTRRAFNNIMGILTNYKSINIDWDLYYRQSSYSHRASKMPGKPFVLDPANPFNNVCNRVRTWETVSKKASETMNKPLLKYIHASPFWE